MNEKTIVELHDPAFRHALHNAHRGCCFYTGREIGLEEMHVDHIMPRLAGGLDTLENLVPTTSFINRSKHAKEDYMTERMVFINRVVFVRHVIKYLNIYLDGVYELICVECGNPFKSRGAKNKFCSQECFQTVYQRRVDIHNAEARKRIEEQTRREKLDAMFKSRYEREMLKLMSEECSSTFPFTDGMDE